MVIPIFIFASCFHLHSYFSCLQSFLLYLMQFINVLIVSYLSTNCREDVEQWLNRRLSSHYLVIYIDTTFIATHRDKQVLKKLIISF